MSKPKYKQFKEAVKDLRAGANPAHDPYLYNKSAIAGRSFTEFEVHAILYYELKQLLEPLDFVVRGELITMSQGLKKPRFDIAIFKNRNPGEPSTAELIRIIEVKTVGWMKKNCPWKQIALYEHFGAPVDLVTGHKEARDYIAKAKIAFPFNKYCVRFPDGKLKKEWEDISTLTSTRKRRRKQTLVPFRINVEPVSPLVV